MLNFESWKVVFQDSLEHEMNLNLVWDLWVWIPTIPGVLSEIRCLYMSLLD